MTRDGLSLKFNISHFMALVAWTGVILGLMRALGIVGGLIALIVVVAAYFVFDRLLLGARTDFRALLGAGLGAVAGAVVGGRSDLGAAVLRFYPDLLERDFGVLFGSIAGFFLGAVTGAIVFSFSARLGCRN